MILRRLTITLGSAFGVAALLAGTSAASAQPPVPPPTPAFAQEGVDVQTRGPVHEAFAEPVASSAPGQIFVVPKQPPDPIEELPADQKPEGPNVQWVPGYWAYDEERTDFLWVSGAWRVPPPNRRWVPGYWNRVDRGFQWVPGLWGPAAVAQVDLLPAPPAAVAEAPPPAPDANSVYVPGTWVYRETRYVWRPGIWIGFRPGWIWIPASYVWTPRGYVFVEGYWDYPLADRGVLFAPVFITPRFLTLRGWVYRPQFVVTTDFMVGSFFVRPDRHHYYFGDYFDPRYKTAGFVAWVDFRGGRNYYDPLYSHYRWDHRGDPRYMADLHRLYEGRARGEIARPPRTLAAQVTLVNTKGVDVRFATAVTPLNKVDRTVIKLKPVTKVELEEHRKEAVHLREVGQARVKVEVAPAVRPGVKVEVKEPVKVPLPESRPATTGGTVKTPPPPPKQPDPHARPAPSRDDKKDPKDKRDKPLSKASATSRNERAADSHARSERKKS